MSGFLLDTNVISALAPAAARQRDAPLAAWLAPRTASLFIPAVAIAELTAGIAKLERLGATQRARRLQDWLETTMSVFADRLLPLDATAARMAGLLQDAARAAGRDPGFGDIAIAGIAQAQGLTLLTRNLRHFAPLGIAVHDPFVSLP